MDSNGKTGTSHDGDIIVGSFVKNAFEEVRVGLRKYNGYDLVQVRVWAHGRESMYPTKRGIAIQRASLPKLIALLEEAQVRIEADASTNGEKS
jgi:Transcriptional Coactivator p15 (PC4)